jgi:exodeoxyribonuclease VII large subunit
VRAVVQGVGLRGQRLRDLGRALPRPETLTGAAAQRLDLWGGRLGAALGMAAAKKRQAFGARAGLMRPELLLGLVLHRRRDLADRARDLDNIVALRSERARTRIDALSARLTPALARLVGDADRRTREGRDKLAALTARLDGAQATRLARLDDRLEALERMRRTLGYAQTLQRGFAVVRGDGAVVTTKAGAEAAAVLEVEFADGRLTLGGKAKARKAGDAPDQGSLF